MACLSLEVYFTCIGDCLGVRDCDLESGLWCFISEVALGRFFGSEFLRNQLGFIFAPQNNNLAAVPVLGKCQRAKSGRCSCDLCFS